MEQLIQALLYIHHGISKDGDSIELASSVPDALQHTDKEKWITILHRDIKPANGKILTCFVGVY